MSVDPETTRIVRSWLDEGVTQLPDRVLDAVLDQVPATRQRRATWWPARRTPIMHKIVTIGLSAAAVALLVIVGAQVLGSPSGGVGSDPAPSLDPTPTLEPIPTLEPTDTPEAGLPQGTFEFADQGLAMTVAIPASGWTFSEPSLLSKGVEVNNLPEAGILFWAFPDMELYVYEDPCRATSTKPETPVATVEEIATALAAQASRDASEPEDVTIGGYEGQRLTLHTPEDAVPGECELDEFAMYGTDGDPLGRYSQGPGQIDELWILDVDGTVVIIDAMSRPDTSEVLLEEMRTIVESTTFEVP